MANGIHLPAVMGRPGRAILDNPTNPCLVRRADIHTKRAKALSWSNSDQSKDALSAGRCMEPRLRAAVRRLAIDTPQQLFTENY